MKNPSLREFPRHQHAQVIPTPQGKGILEWLEESGRMMAREETDFDYQNEEAEINDLMVGEESFDEDDDDDDDLALD